MIEFYNSQIEDFEVYCKHNDISDPKAHVGQFIDRDPTKISWSSGLIPKVVRKTFLSPESGHCAIGTYRPFSKQVIYFDDDLNDRRGSLPKIFPTSEHPNLGLYCVGMGSAVPFSVLITDALPDLHVTGAGSGGQFFPRYTYEHKSGAANLFSDDTADGYTRIDNITDAVPGT